MLAGFESLPHVEDGDNDCPDFVFYLAETLITVDHQTRETHLIGSVFSGEDVAQQYFGISQRLESLHQQLQSMPETPTLTSGTGIDGAGIDDAVIGRDISVSVDKSDEEFCDNVLELKWVSQA